MMLCDSLEKSDLSLFVGIANVGEWIANEKYDGDRIKLVSFGGLIKLFNRRGIEVTEKYPEFEMIKLPDCTLDGEMCVLINGVSNFNAGITHRSHNVDKDKIYADMETYPVTYMVFDVLEWDTQDIRAKSLKERIEYLKKLTWCPCMQVAKYEMDIMQMWKDVIDKGGEGIILKHLYSPYEDRRSSFWKKVKNIKEVDIRVTSFVENPKGIRVETDSGVGVQVSGRQHEEVEAEINNKGSALITIRHLGYNPESGKFRQPTYLKLVESD